MLFVFKASAQWCIIENRFLAVTVFSLHDENRSLGDEHCRLLWDVMGFCKVGSNTESFIVDALQEDQEHLHLICLLLVKEMCCILIVVDSNPLYSTNRTHTFSSKYFDLSCFETAGLRLAPHRSVLSEMFPTHASKIHPPPPPASPPLHTPPSAVCIKAELDQTLLYDDLINEDRRQCSHAILQSSWCCCWKQLCSSQADSSNRLLSFVIYKDRIEEELFFIFLAPEWILLCMTI